MAKAKVKEILDTTDSNHEYHIAFKKSPDMKSGCSLCEKGQGCQYYLKGRKPKHGAKKPKAKNKRRVKKKD